MVNNVSKDFYPKQIPNQLNYQTDNMSLTFLQTCLSSSSVRQELLLKGIDSAKQYLEKKNEIIKITRRDEYNNDEEVDTELDTEVQEEVYEKNY
jgi:hypothetical protein